MSIVYGDVACVRRAELLEVLAQQQEKRRLRRVGKPQFRAHAVGKREYEVGHLFVLRGHHITLDADWRDRWVVNIAIEDTSKEAQAKVRAIALLSYLSRGDVPVVVVFGIHPGEEPGNGATGCRAEGTIDGQGHSGDAESILGYEDDGQIQVEMGGIFADTPPRLFHARGSLKRQERYSPGDAQKHSE